MLIEHKEGSFKRKEKHETRYNIQYMYPIVFIIFHYQAKAREVQKTHPTFNMILKKNPLGL
jgi:hypothetical protein